MNWILIAYLLGLIFLSTRLSGTTGVVSLRIAWFFFAVIPLWQFIMHLCRIGNRRDPSDLQLIELWDQAVPSLLFGISLLCLLGALAPNRKTS